MARHRDIRRPAVANASAKAPAFRKLSAAAFAAVLAASGSAFAAELSLPVPTTVIYPGQSVTERGLDHRNFIVNDEKIALFVVSEDALAGQVARRTLLPGQAIRIADLKAPDLVRAGTAVTMIYAEDGLVITGSGTALRSAGEGETIRVRNDESGIVVSGTVAGDGSVRIEG